MMIRFFGPLFFLLVGIGSQSDANALVLYDFDLVADSYAAAPLGFTATLASPNDPEGGGLITGDILFTAPASGAVTITLTDLGAVGTGRAGSVYEAVLDGVSLGITAATPINGAALSAGSFSASVTAGRTVDLGVWNIVATFLGLDSPYGGGTVGSDFQDANVSIVVTQSGMTPSVPEPATMSLLGLGLFALAAWRRQRPPEPHRTA